MIGRVFLCSSLFSSYRQLVRRYLGNEVFCAVCHSKFRVVSIGAVRICDSCWSKCIRLNGGHVVNCEHCVKGINCLILKGA